MLQAFFDDDSLSVEQIAFITRVGAKSVPNSDRSFYIQADKIDNSLIEEIVRLFHSVAVFDTTNDELGSYKYGASPWKTLNYRHAMVPGFDNSPAYKVESVELCLL